MFKVSWYPGAEDEFCASAGNSRNSTATLRLGLVLILLLVGTLSGQYHYSRHLPHVGWSWQWLAVDLTSARITTRCSGWIASNIRSMGVGDNWFDKRGSNRENPNLLCLSQSLLFSRLRTMDGCSTAPVGYAMPVDCSSDERARVTCHTSSGT